MPLPPLRRVASFQANLAHTLRGAFVAVYLFGSLLAINLLQTASLVLRPFSRRSFRRVNRWSADRFWDWCARTTLSLHRTRVVISGDELPPAENAVVIANHQSMTDVQALFLLARKAGRLGDLKWFVKNSSSTCRASAGAWSSSTACS
jgi:1-acyl-sn-glycerol-3-phosphate acyltransferase